jgi:hypothetical protein
MCVISMYVSYQRMYVCIYVCMCIYILKHTHTNQVLEMVKRAEDIQEQTIEIYEGMLD